MKYELVITADTNDADYVTSIETIGEEVLNDIVIPVTAAIKALDTKKNHYNWPDMWDRPYDSLPLNELYPQLTEEQIEWFRDLCPSFEGGIHTIESVTYYAVPEKIKLL